MRSATIWSTTEERVVRTKTVHNSRCGKQVYTSKKLAKSTANHQSKTSGDRIEAYHCYGCHGYHIGHPPAPFDPNYQAAA